MANYRLLKKAADDLEGLYEFGILTFGLEQADFYYDALLNRLQMIAGSPEHYPSVDYIRPGYRRCLFGVHSIYYRIDAEDVAIVRILGRQDSAKAFD